LIYQGIDADDCSLPMTKKNLYMLNWISIIALAMALFVSRLAVNEKVESRPVNKTLSTQSIQSANYPMDDPLIVLLMPSLFQEQ